MLVRTVVTVALVLACAAVCGKPITTVRPSVQASSPLLRRVQETRFERAILERHGMLVEQLRNEYKQCMSELSNLTAAQARLQTSKAMVDMAVETASALVGALQPTGAVQGTLQRDETYVAPRSRVSGILDMIAGTPRQNIDERARPCLRRKFWRRMRAAQTVDIPDLIRVRDLGKKFQSYAQRRQREIEDSIAEALQVRTQITNRVPEGIPRSAVFGRGFNTQ
ncbi:Secreted protein [Plasmodiophora brassicae]